jgi:MFS family permease
VALTVAVIGFAFVNPSLSALVSRRADPARQGEVQGVSQACASLGRIAGPVAGSVVFEWSDTRILPYVLACLLLIVVVTLIPSVRAGGQLVPTKPPEEQPAEKQPEPPSA